MNYIITAIDTDAGKTIVTGLLARYIKQQGGDVITMKMAQTGCVDVSDDIIEHRKIMGIPMQDVDKEGVTCPYLFKFPASPHLAAAMEGITIDILRIKEAYHKLSEKYSTVLLEGVGGLMVPLNKEELLIDFISQLFHPVILVTSGRLGSINHTLLSLEILKKRQIPLYGIVYNHYPVTEPEITQDSSDIIKQHMLQYFPGALWSEIPELKDNYDVDFDGWF